MKRWLNSNLAVAVRRLALVYLALGACRVIFYICNRELLGAVTAAEAWPLLKGAFKFDTVSVVYAFGLFIVASLIPFRLRERAGYQKALKLYFMAASALVTALNLADAVYFHYAQKRFTADEFYFAANDNNARLVWQFLLENWYLALAWIAMIVALRRFYKYSGRPHTPVKDKRAYFGMSLAVLALAAGLSVGGARGGFDRTTRPITLSNATLYTPSPAKANLILSNPFCLLRTIGESDIGYTEYYTGQELERIFTPRHGNSDPLVNLGRRNVVIFILESFSAEHSAYLNPQLHDNGGYTPFLDSLMRSGYTFTNAFSNGRKSIEALPSIWASMPSFRTPFILLPQSLGESRPLPKILRDEGYQTAFFCGSPRGSMGFGAYAALAGIENLYSRQDYESARGRGDFDGYWGIWDEKMLDYMGEELSQMRQPFFASVFTLSSHHPFVIPAEYEGILPEGRTRIHKGVAYTDMAVRRFFERYGSQQWFAETLFVFVADHVSSETFAPETLTPVGNSHIISFIYTPDGALQGTDAQTSQQIDIMPTLLGLLGYEGEYFAFGRDVFNEPERKPVAVNYFDQSFHAITDSLSIYFDGERVLKAYSRSDKLQRHDISPLLPNGEIETSERVLKALIQQYYSHLERRSYVVSDSAANMP